MPAMGIFPLPVSAWTISIVQCAARNIFSIEVPSFIAICMPYDAATRCGMTVVHFFDRDEAEGLISSSPTQTVECTWDIN